MSGLPETRGDLARAYYTFNGNAVCRICRTQIEWWTTTHGKKMPFDLMADMNSDAVPHWATCAEKMKAIIREDLVRETREIKPPAGQTRGAAAFDWLLDRAAEALAQLKVAEKRTPR